MKIADDVVRAHFYPKDLHLSDKMSKRRLDIDDSYSRKKGSDSDYRYEYDILCMCGSYIR